MAQMSYLWTTGDVGDGAGTYSRTDWQKIAQILGGAYGDDGVVASKTYGSLHGATTGANNFRLFKGVAIVDGKPYINDAPIDFTVPSAAGAGNTRMDIIALRADWTAQTARAVRIEGTDAASPTPPALTQIPGTLYELPLWRITINTAGAMDSSNSPLDIRKWAAGPMIARRGYPGHTNWTYFTPTAIPTTPQPVGMAGFQFGICQTTEGWTEFVGDSVLTHVYFPSLEFSGSPFVFIQRVDSNPVLTIDKVRTYPDAFEIVSRIISGAGFPTPSTEQLRWFWIAVGPRNI